MHACSCGVAHDENSDTCPVSLSQPMTHEVLRQSTSKNEKSPSGKRNWNDEQQSSDEPTSSTLIEFPGAARAIPEWRRQLSQRVREVQERKAREAAEELAAAREAGLVSCALPSGQLELVADLEKPAMNPIVSKALERLDRARRNERMSSPYAATAAALAPDPRLFAEPEFAEPLITESWPRLTVVEPPQISEPTPALVTPSPDVPEPAVTAPLLPLEVNEPITTSSIELDETGAELLPEPKQPNRKPVRLISDDDIALSYLENCLSVPALVDDSRSDLASLSRRTVAGFFDLLLLAVMVSPAAAAIQYSGAHWSNLRVIEWMGGITAATMFAYLMLSTAMTGRTLAMRIFSIRTIDLHTGLIPTGGQSFKRALSHVFSLAFLGLGLAYAVIDPDRRTMPDRFSHTIVIRD